MALAVFAEVFDACASFGVVKEGARGDLNNEIGAGFA
jgi:hypothetical protein